MYVPEPRILTRKAIVVKQGFGHQPAKVVALFIHVAANERWYWHNNA